MGFIAEYTILNPLIPQNPKHWRPPKSEARTNLLPMLGSLMDQLTESSPA